MKKVIFTLSIFLCLFFDQLKAQNIFPVNGSAGIGTTTPNSSSLMEMTSTTKGLLIPRMTQAQRNTIVSPATGLMIYQTNTTPGFYYYDGSNWQPVSAKGANTALSNLKSPTAVNMDLLPGSNAVRSLGSASSTWKNIYLNALSVGDSIVFSAPGTANIFVGKAAGHSNTTGSSNTATGTRALFNNTSGAGNTASGYRALGFNTTGYYNTANGVYALYSNITGIENIASGHAALFKNFTGSNNVAIGTGASYSDSTGNSNVAVGSNALFSNRLRSNLVAVGDSALYNNTTGYFNTALGSKVLYTNIGGYQNTATGYHALYLNTLGNNNTATGLATLSYNTTGSENTATGTSALTFNTTGSKNTASGSYSLYNNESGYNNVAIGSSALFYNFEGSNLVAVGDSALFNQNGGYGQNTAIGSKALFLNTSGGNNTAIGYHSLYSNNGADNIAVGSFVLENNTDGSENTGVGSSALNNNTAGTANSAFGFRTLVLNTTGYDNTAMGRGALYGNATGIKNTATGDDALGYNSTGNYNTATGSNALYGNVIGTGNTATGYNSLYYSNSGANTAVGYAALSGVTSGGTNTAIGYGADVSVGNLTNTISVGYSTVVNASNKAVIGNNNVTVIGGHVGWSILSDGRFKTNIKENVPGLEFINKLRPVTYGIDETKYAKFIGIKDSLINADKDVYNRISQKIRTGFIAQDVEKTAQEINYDFDGINRPQNDKDNYSLVYSDFVPSLVKAVQQLSKSNDDKDAKINDLQKQIDDLKAIIVSKQTTVNVQLSTASKATATSNAIQQNNIRLNDAAALEQNIPNPFNSTTAIHYTLPQAYSSAQIIITDKNGKALKQVNLPAGTQSVSGKGKGALNFDASILSAGTYNYAMYVDGKMIGSKQMVVIK